jgi:feruloyl-CoA synthase
VSSDHAKLKGSSSCSARTGVHRRFGEVPTALAAVGASAHPIAALLEHENRARIDEAFAAIGPDTVAKILFTSGSTGPEGRDQHAAHALLQSASWAQSWPFLEDAPPVLCEWLPWNHTFGGNATFNIVLRNGGTLYIDGGKPTPDLIVTTARNLREISPTVYFNNVPRGYDLLLPLLESDEALRRSFFSALDAMFYAGAALPQNLYDRLHALIRAERTARTVMLSGWGATETAPLAAIVHFPIDRAGCDRQSGARHRAEAAAVGQQARSPRPGTQCNARLLPERRAHARRVRRGGLLQDRRCDAPARPG